VTLTLLVRVRVTVPFVLWRRGWDSARPLRGLPADRPLRGCVGRTGLEVLNHTRRENEKAPRGGLFIFWRRGWDSNPRYGRTVHLISSQAHSTTLAPLLNSLLSFDKMPCGHRTPPECCIAGSGLYAGTANFNTTDHDKTVKSGHNAGPATAQRGEHCLSSRSN
jgi:hypothetical protein